MSIRPFLHPVTEDALMQHATEPTTRDAARHEEKVEAGEKGAMVTQALTAEGADRGLAPGATSDIFAGPLRIEWGHVTYVILRDQASIVLSPFLVRRRH